MFDTTNLFDEAKIIKTEQIDATGFHRDFDGDIPETVEPDRYFDDTKIVRTNQIDADGFHRSFDGDVPVNEDPNPQG